YDRNDRLFAWYEHAGRAGGHVASAPRLKPRRSGVYFTNGDLFVSQEIRMGDQPLGSVFLTASMGQVDSRLHRYVGFVCLVLLVSLGVALLFSTRMQRKITGPLAQLSNVARLVASQKDYSVRAIR